VTSAALWPFAHPALRNARAGAPAVRDALVPMKSAPWSSSGTSECAMSSGLISMRSQFPEMRNSTPLQNSPLLHFPCSMRTGPSSPLTASPWENESFHRANAVLVTSRVISFSPA
jgi:hypothetical protein